MRRALSVAGVAALSVAACACGGSSTTTVTVTHTVAELNPSSVALDKCTKPGHVTNSGYNWGARVSGISCDQAGRFIRQSIFPVAQKIQFVKRGQTIHFQAGGFVCDASKNTDPSIGGWNVACANGDQDLAFYWTP